jgi:hypothetical protein
MTMRKLVINLVVVSALLVLSMPAAEASLSVPVTGSFTATGSLSGSCPPTALSLHQVVDGTSSLSPPGPSSFHLDFCIASPPGGLDWPVLTGATFSLTTPQGTLAGSMGGFVQANNQTPNGFPLHLLLIVASGTGALQGATGTVVLDGFFSVGAVTATGTVSGTLTLPTPTPKNKNECKHDGWRNLADDHGQPFKNQGQCVSWAVHHTR